MVAKAAMFLVILVLANILLLMARPTWQTAALVALVAWSASRAHFLACDVVERDIDPRDRFAGLTHLARWWWRRHRTR